MLGLLVRVLGKPISDLRDRPGEGDGGGNDLIRPICEIDGDRRPSRERPWIAPVSFAGQADRFPGAEKCPDRAIVKRDHTIPHISILRCEARHPRFALQRANQNRRHPILGTREELRVLNPVLFSCIRKPLAFEERQDNLERLFKTADISLKVEAIGEMLGREIPGSQAQNEPAVTQGDYIICGARK